MFYYSEASGVSVMGRGKGDWCILMTTAGRTLPLARALAGLGITAWTPVRTERRTGRGKQRKEVVQVEQPITPTFVFVAASDMAEVLRLRALPICPVPAFRPLRHRDRIPEIRDASLASLRAAEERFRVSHLKSTRRRIAVGTPVHMSKGAFAGMTGIVERGGDKDAQVNFGHGFIVTIASYLIETDVIREENKPALGLAA